VSLTRDGTYAGGKVLSTYMNAQGVPTRDDDERGRKMVKSLSAEDFGERAARIAGDGSITPPG